jgi:hypothetical protein
MSEPKDDGHGAGYIPGGRLSGLDAARQMKNVDWPTFPTVDLAATEKFGRPAKTVTKRTFHDELMTETVEKSPYAQYVMPLPAPKPKPTPGELAERRVVRVTGHMDKLESDHADFDALLKARQRKQNAPRARREIVRVSMSQTLDPHTLRPRNASDPYQVDMASTFGGGGGGMGGTSSTSMGGGGGGSFAAAPTLDPFGDSGLYDDVEDEEEKRSVRFLTSNNNSSSSSNDNSPPNQNNKSNKGNRSGGGGGGGGYNDYYDPEAVGPEDMLKWREELDDLNAALYAPPLEPGDVDPTTGKKLKAARGGGSGTEDGHFPLTRLAERQAAERREALALQAERQERQAASGIASGAGSGEADLGEDKPPYLSFGDPVEKARVQEHARTAIDETTGKLLHSGCVRRRRRVKALIDTIQPVSQSVIRSRIHSHATILFLSLLF